MFNRLQKKWHVNGWRLVLILVTFAVGGSLTGWVGKKIMQYTGIENPVIFIIVYVLLVTAIWPLMVLLVSIVTGQFLFFSAYLKKMWQRMSRNPGVRNTNATQKKGEMEYGRVSAKNLVIFASGAGSNAKKIIEHFRGSPLAHISLIVSNKATAGVLSIAKEEGIPVLHIEKERFFRGDAYLQELGQAGADLIILAGFLWKIPDALISAFPRRIINIHPALLPHYGGKGMYGNYVHEAVLNAGEVQSGITIHYVDEHYDHGDIIFQAVCPVLEGDSAETLAARIHQLEHVHYPREIEKLLRKE